MKNNFYEGVSKKRSRRRRFTSLVLVLSLFVTSGVSWSLHGVGITMANESECGQEEHKHTDECYEKQLVCGLEEDENHIHSDECYETKLVCGKTEHVHDEECYIDSEGRELLSNDDLDEVVIEGAVINPNGDIVIGDNKDEENSQAEEAAVEAATEFTESSPENEITATDLAAENVQPMLLSDSVDIPSMFAEGDSSSLPPTINTVDNIAEGIKFTLFNYGDATLENQNNNYYYQWDSESNTYTHPNVKDSGINSGRNVNDDIMFFAYGTPPPHGEKIGEGTDENGNTIEYFKPGTHDKNSYSGDYNFNSYESGNRAVQGIVQSNLGADGYPKVVGSGNSLDYLFNNTPASYKQVYSDVNHLLKKVTSDKGVDHLVFNSNENYAYFNQDTNEFEVYDRTFDIINDNHHKAGDVNNIKFDANEKPIKYDKDVDPGFKIGFFPFDEYDESRKDPNYDGNGYDHHFGMKMEASFSNPAYDGINVKEPITFKYSGDDDMWVFVDGKLVLDLGGIHEPAGGMIDFSNGLVWAQDNSQGKTLATIKSEGNYSDEAWAALPKPIGIDTASTSSDSVNKWIVKPITDYISDWNDDANGEHDIKMFYIERGGCYSNLAMEMNLPTLKPLSVTKNVDYKQHLDKTYDNIDYWFQVYEWDKTNETWVIPQSEHPDSPFYLEDNRFKIKAGERKKFDDLGQDRKFKVVEIGYGNNPQNNGPEVEMSSEVFEKVTVTDQNNEETTLSIIDGAAETEGAALKDMNSYNFKNTIQEDFTNINVKKEWSPNLKPESSLNDFVVKFKIMRTDSVTGEVKQVALKDDEGIKKRTFTISSQEWNEGVTINHLLSRYGDHFYTYSVEELNVPKGYKAAYGTAPDGSMVITNTDVTKMQINVKKEWENVSGTEPRIRLRLTRKKVGYEGSKPTALTINILDEGGNSIKSQTITPSSENKIYAGGSVEFAYVLPKGAELYYDDPAYPQQTPEKLRVKYDDGVLVLDNLAAINPEQPDTIPNVVTFKVKTDKAEDSLLILHHSFTGDTNGWGCEGGSISHEFDRNKDYATGGYITIADRDKAWNGATITLDPALFHVNKTYTFTAYVYSPVTTTFKMSFNNGLGHYDQITNPPVQVAADTWKKLTGTIKLPAEIDPYGMYIKVEESNDFHASSFRMDEFIAVEGNSPIDVEGDSGKVIVSGAPAVSNTEVYNFTFNSATLSDGWSKNGNPSLQEAGGALRIYGRGDNNDASIQRSTRSIFQPGHKYKIELGSQRDNTNGANNVHLSVQYSLNGQTQYSPWLCDTNLNDTSNDHFIHYSATSEFSVPANADMSNSRMYFGTNSDTRSFRLRYLKITDITETPTPVSESKNGYEIIDGKYKTDYSNYKIVMDPNSVTDPMHLLSDYTPDRINNDDPTSPLWERVVTLDNTTGWTYHWDNEQNTQDPHKIEEDSARFLYKYYIEEVWVDNEGNVIGPVDGDLMSADGNYLVTYMNNGVATNDAANPILVKNKYIWYKLPDTGGIGVDFIYAIGLFLMITGLIGGTALIRRERRSD